MRSFFLLALFLRFIDVFGEYYGVVYVDINNNNVFDNYDKCLTEVCVSDGLNVVMTDKNGKYILPGHELEKFIFITTPSGYKTENAYYKKIEKGCKEYNFKVIPCNSRNDDCHSFIHISDTEIGGTSGHERWLGELRDFASQEEVSFIIHTGDICYKSGLKSHIEIMNTTNMNTQVFYCIGNHDLVDGKYGEELFEELYGPVYYSFDSGNVHYIVTPMLWGDYKPGYNKADVFNWLKNDLEQQPEGKPIIFFNHDLITREECFKFYKNDLEYIDLEDYNFKGWFYGHWHFNHIRKHKKAYSICTSTPICGGIDHSYAAFRVVKVNNNGDFSSELRYSNIDKKIEIASINKGCIPVTEDEKVVLSVNTYSTKYKVKNVFCYITVGGEDYTDFCELHNKTDFNWANKVKLPDVAIGETVNVKAKAVLVNGEEIECEKSFIYNPSRQINIKHNRENWNNFLGNASHNGLSNQKIKGIPNLKWLTNVGSNIFMVSPLIADDKLFIATVDDNNNGNAFVVALDIYTGKEIWRSKVDGSIKNSMTLSKGNVYAQDIYGNLYSFSQKNGSLRWRKKLHVDDFLPPLVEGIVSEDGIIYAGTGKGLCAVDAVSGKDFWCNTGWKQKLGSTSTLSVGGSVVIGSSHWDGLYANDIKSGELKWCLNADKFRNRSSTPIIVEDTVFVTSFKHLLLLDVKTGKVLRNIELDEKMDVASSPLVTENKIILGTASEGLLALERNTLMKKWCFKTKPSLMYTVPYVGFQSCTVETSPILLGNTIYFASSDGYIRGLDKDNGTLLWEHSVGVPLFSTLSFVGNALFAADFAGNVYCYVLN